MNHLALHDADIGCARAKGLLGWLLRFGALIGAIPPQKYHHVYLVNQAPLYFDHKIVWWVTEAAPPKVDSRLLTEEDLVNSDFYRIKGLTETQKRKVILWALDKKGEPYDHKDNLLWALEIMVDWILRHFWVRMEPQRAYKCTDLVYSAFMEAIGLRVCKADNVKRVWPSCFADSELTEEVQP